MNIIKKLAPVLALTIGTLGADASCLWVIGDATPYGWSTDDATALLSDPENEAEYSGTLYLEAGKDFKFMTQPDFGNEEYGAAPGASLENGSVALAKGTDDSGYGKIQVAETANYLITVDLDKLTATIVKSAYQDSKITMCSLFLVGSAAPNGWDVMQGAPLYQNAEKPYEFGASKLQLEAGTFKLAAELKGACSWDAKYWYFRDAADDAKIARGQDGDLQWSIDAAGKYDIDVNTLDNTIAIAKSTSTAISSVEADDAAVEYYTLDGLRVAEPRRGQVYVCKRGSSVSKQLLR